MPSTTEATQANLSQEQPSTAKRVLRYCGKKVKQGAVFVKDVTLDATGATLGAIPALSVAGRAGQFICDKVLNICYGAPQSVGGTLARGTVDSYAAGVGITVLGGYIGPRVGRIVFRSGVTSLYYTVKEAALCTKAYFSRDKAASGEAAGSNKQLPDDSQAELDGDLQIDIDGKQVPLQRCQEEEEDKVVGGNDVFRMDVVDGVDEETKKPQWRSVP